MRKNGLLEVRAHRLENTAAVLRHTDRCDFILNNVPIPEN
jgi:hypothetical protein